MIFYIKINIFVSQMKSNLRKNVENLIKMI